MSFPVPLFALPVLVLSCARYRILASEPAPPQAHTPCGFPRAIASEFPFIHAPQRIPDDARTDGFVQGKCNIPLILLKKVDAIALATLPEHLAQLAEMHGQSGHIKEGFHLLHKAEAIIEQTEEKYYQAELYRLKGDLFLK